MLSHNYAVYVEGSGIMATNVSWSQNPEVSFIPTFGQKQLLGSNGQNISVGLGYVFNTLGDPFLRQIIEQPTGSIAKEMSIIGRSGYFHLNSFSFQANGLKPLEISTSFTCFNRTSGSIRSQDAYTFSDLNEVLANNSSISLEVESARYRCNSASYEYSSKIVPRYKIGDAYPIDVVFMGSDERVNLSLWTGYSPNFHGSLSTDLFTGRAYIVIKNDDQTNWTNEYRVPLSGFAIQSYSDSLSVNDLVRYNVSLVKSR